jgi:hypothetical protein
MATQTEKAREIDSGRTASVPEPIADSPVGDDGLLNNKRDPEPWRPGDTQHVTTSTETEEKPILTRAVIREGQPVKFDSVRKPWN